MTMVCNDHRVISIAAATGKLGCVLMVGCKVECWKIFRRNKLGPYHATEQTQIWIKTLNPEALVTENVGWRSRKTRRTIRNIHAIEKVGRDADLVVLTVLRHRRRALY